MSWYIRSFFGFTFLIILYSFKCSCTNIFHSRSLYTIYGIIIPISMAHWPSASAAKLRVVFIKQGISNILFAPSLLMAKISHLIPAWISETAVLCINFPKGLDNWTESFRQAGFHEIWVQDHFPLLLEPRCLSLSQQKCPYGSRYLNDAILLKW